MAFFFPVSSWLYEVPSIFYLLRIKTIKVSLMIESSISNFIILGFHGLLFLFSLLGNFAGDCEVRSSRHVNGSHAGCRLSACN